MEEKEMMLCVLLVLYLFSILYVIFFLVWFK